MMKQYDGIKDEELISRFKNGESEILDYLMEKYKNMVRKKARTMFLIGGENDDLIQEGMIGLFKAVRDYQPDRDAAFQTFASICVDRQIYNAIQSSNRQKHQPLNSYISLSEQDGENEEHLGDNWGENPESIIIDQENVQDLEQEITATLSPMENQVLEYYLAGNGYGEIAQIMGKTPKSIDNALQRIRIKIREQLEQYQK
ncbi:MULTISPECIES: RNA polymerase sporulation sigma factor SigH [Blautia]|nr:MULTISPECIES: RNA polymerase sporulation sigma factor SigH [Blautia]MDU2989918.1 RNA polymerase sporulation sigma factor SigH [Lachnospiraceae bacterium]MDU5953563.1 RNA polymerase sporulation sigma factor SigH [Ruminococcus sp.]MCQ5299633.1 RNA polymerase sporulation sigma factor SigH [Blautia wexlerae]MDB2176804.1 RNA polymerase sporulation sigma factor SigH [Blautia wexlerae]MDB6439968.1 RNA polymerase sporulation sigma factor SigH [Blautia wexlerae]